MMVQHLGMWLLVRRQDMEEGRRSVARSSPRVQRPCGTEGGGQVEWGRGPGVESLLVKNLEKEEEETGVKIESCTL